MIELSTAKKNKICLADYNYRKDIEHRLLMAQFSALDVAILEEILFSPLSIPLEKLGKGTDATPEKVLRSLKKLEQADLLRIEGSVVIVDKEMRKYYESQFQKFEPDFKPDMEFLQGLLRKVPIHVLPLWYAIPRTSDNIFDSLIEKYLATPQVFHRYLLDLNFADPTLSAIAQDVFRAPDFKIDAKALMGKYGLSKEQFEECMLHLEFSFICCLGYEKEGDEWKEVVTPFHEWREYLTFLRDTAPKPIVDMAKVVRLRDGDYAFVQDMAAILTLIKKEPVAFDTPGYNALLRACELSEEHKGYIDQVIRKLRLLKLAEITGGKLQVLEGAHEWLEMRLEGRALFLYRHPLNKICTQNLPDGFGNERLIREAEKTIARVVHSGWVIFDEFFQGVLQPLSDKTTISLKKVGRCWRYTLPEYSPEEAALIKAAIFEWLFEAGMTAIGTYEEKECFLVTPFGQSLFG